MRGIERDLALLITGHEPRVARVRFSEEREETAQSVCKCCGRVFTLVIRRGPSLVFCGDDGCNKFRAAFPGRRVER